MIHNADLLFTISNEMRETYKNIFKKDSYIIRQIVESLADKSILSNNKDELTFLYAGGLAHRRHETLQELTNVIMSINDRKLFYKRLKLKIYSGTEIKADLARNIFNRDEIEYHSSVPKDELYNIYRKADILVFVESFNRRSKEAVRLSFSTKIPEYLSVKKPILAIGPADVSSMKYLANAALCVNDYKDLYRSVIMIAKDSKLREELTEKSRKLYEKNHEISIQALEFWQRIMGIFNGQHAK